MIQKKKNGKKIAVYVVLTLGALPMLLPFCWMILTAFKTQGEAIRMPLIFFPSHWRLDSFRDVFSRLPFGAAYFNTIISAIATILGQLVMCSMAGYAFGRIKFPGRDLIFICSLSVIMIPSSFFILPQYLIIQKLGLLNTVWALFIPNLFSAFGTFLMRQFFMSLPKDLEEAAHLDGCTQFGIFWRVMLPLVKPGLTSLAVITLKFAWNDLLWPMVVNTSAKKMTLSAILANLTGQYSTRYPTLMAGSLMAVLPLVLLFALFQKQFIEGIALTGTKG